MLAGSEFHVCGAATENARRASSVLTLEATAEQTSSTCEIEEQAGYVYIHIIY